MLGWRKGILPGEDSENIETSNLPLVDPLVSYTVINFL